MSTPEMSEGLRRQVNEAVPLIDVDDPDYRLHNSKELILASPGLRLSDFELGDQIVITTDTVNGYEGYLKFELVAWSGQKELSPAKNVRAWVKSSNLPGISRDTDIQIHGASLGKTSLGGEHLGEIRANCNLLVTPIITRDFYKTAYGKESNESIEFLVKRGLIERSTHGYYKGYYVMLDTNYPPIMLPEVNQVYCVDKQSGEELPVDWKSPAQLLP